MPESGRKSEPAPLGRGVFVAAGDVNGDGRADLYLVGRDGQTLLLPYIEQDNL